jgi:hypothetical protein
MLLNPQEKRKGRRDDAELVLLYIVYMFRRDVSALYVKGTGC